MTSSFQRNPRKPSIDRVPVPRFWSFIGRIMVLASFGDSYELICDSQKRCGFC